MSEQTLAVPTAPAAPTGARAVPARAGRRTSALAIQLGLLLTLLVVGSVLRFYGLAERGLYGSDTVYYTNLAEHWSAGETVYGLGGRRDSYRPVVFWLFGAAVDVFGFHDDSIKKLNAGLDVLNILLVFAIAFGVSGRRFAQALAASALYAVLPFALYMCRQELTHTASAFFVLTAVWLAFLAAKASSHRTRWALIAAAGGVCGLAALVHEDLAFVGVALLIYLGALTWNTSSGRAGRRLRAVALCCGLFGLPAALAGSSMVLHNWHRALTLASSVTAPEAKKAAEATAPAEAAAPAEVETPQSAKVAAKGLGRRAVEQALKVARFTWDASLGTSSVAVAWLFVAQFGIFLGLSTVRNLGASGRGRVGKVLRSVQSDGWRSPRMVVLPVLVIGVYMGLYSIFFEYFFTRLFLPFIPLIFVFLATFGPWLLRRLPTVPRRMILVVAVAGMAVANFEHFSQRLTFMPRHYSDTFASGRVPFPPDFAGAFAELRETSYRTSWAREVYDRLGDRVDSKARLLVTSSLLYPHAGRRELQVGYYFGDDAVYLFDHDRPLATLVRELDIRWVLYTTYRADSRFLQKDEAPRYLGGGRWSEPLPSTLGVPYGLERATFSLAAEYAALQAFLTKSEASVELTRDTFARGEPPTLSAGDESYVIYRLPAQVPAQVPALVPAESAP